MATISTNPNFASSAGLNRREFIHAGAVSTLGLALPAYLQAKPQATDINCILLFLVGGPSHLETWDLKPNAPDNIRGPFHPIRTNVPGIDISEHFPRMATLADRYAIIRSVHHQAAPIHETGHQLMQTGRLFRSGQEYPHYGAVVSQLRGPSPSGLPPFVVLPGPIGNTGVSVSHGQTAGHLGVRHDPISLQDMDDATSAVHLAGEAEELQRRYGLNHFGQSCLLARRLVERGVKFVTVNMFDTVFDTITWDCHADGGSLASNLDDYKTTLCPMFDLAYSALLEDLAQREMLANTLVVAMGEFGRTPQLNNRGGRDHWPGVWSVLFAGGRVQGGQVIGASDRHGAEPRLRPVTPADVAASVYAGMGIDPTAVMRGPDGEALSLTDGAPVAELFRA
jgi:hypothetical protein